MLIPKAVTLIIFSFIIYCANSTAPTQQDCFTLSTADTSDGEKKQCVRKEPCTNHPTQQYQYGFVIDAGSSGSRIFAYKWKQQITGARPEEIPPNCELVESKTKKELGKMNEAGPVSKIQSEDDAKTELDKMINYVKELHEIKKEEPNWKQFPIYLKATAGLRLILNHKQRIKTLGIVRSYFNDPNSNPFRFQDDFSIIASGTEEATYDWLGVNYLNNTLKYPSSENKAVTTGALDLGGASTQIAFVPDDTSDIIDEFTFVKPFYYSYRLYAVSHLGYGAQEVANRIAAKVWVQTFKNDPHRFNTERPLKGKNPCLFKGYDTETYQVKGKIKPLKIPLRYIPKEYHAKIKNTKKLKDKLGNDIIEHHQKGAPNHVECRDYLIEVLNLESPNCAVFSKKQCSINGVYIPPIPSTMKWVAFSSFAYNIPSLFSRNKGGDGGLVNKNPTLSEIYTFITQKLFKLKWDDIKEADILPYYEKPEFTVNSCLYNMYIYVLLKYGYHFDDETARNIDWMLSIKNKEGKEQSVGWQWGSILYDANVLQAVTEKNQHWRAHYKEIKKAAVKERKLENAKEALQETPLPAKAQSDYMDYMDYMHDMNDGNRYYHQMNPLLLTVSVIFMMVIICIYCICGLGVIGFYSFCCYHQYNKATSDQQHIDIESL